MLIRDKSLSCSGLSLAPILARFARNQADIGNILVTSQPDESCKELSAGQPYQAADAFASSIAAWIDCHFVNTSHCLPHLRMIQQQNATANTTCLGEHARCSRTSILIRGSRAYDTRNFHCSCLALPDRITSCSLCPQIGRAIPHDLPEIGGFAGIVVSISSKLFCPVCRNCLKHHLNNISLNVR